MDINCTSSAGRTFKVSFDPLTVATLIGLAVGDAEQRKLFFLKGSVDSTLKLDELDESGSRALENFSDVYLDQSVEDAYAPSVMEAFETFVAEFKLLQTGAGSERTCMDSFWNLCESLQGD